MLSSLDQRIRKNLEAIRDEFTMLYLKHPPLRHNRITSPLEITKAGWEAFASLNFSNLENHRFYVSSEESYLGIFIEDGLPTNSPPSILGNRGFAEFFELCHRLGFLLIRKPIERWEAVSAWMDILHNLAELQATPILIGEAHHYFPPSCDDLVLNDGDEFVLYEDEVDLSQLIDERSNGTEKFPKHPFVGYLGRDVFRSSAAGINILLDPETFFVWRKYSDEIMPFNLSDLISKNLTIVPAHETQQVRISDLLPDFLFAKTGVNNWTLRFRNSKSGKIEHGEFQHMVGFEYYSKLLQSGQNGLRAIDLSPPTNGPSESPTFLIDESQYSDHFDDVQISGTGSLWLTIDRDGVQELQDEIALLENSLNTVPPGSELAKELGSQLKKAKRDLHNRVVQNPKAKPVFDAINRVKGCLRRMRTTIRAEDKMPGFALFLEANVKLAGDGWRYTPEGHIQWYFTLPE